jgi:hypothetical protein
VSGHDERTIKHTRTQLTMYQPMFVAEADDTDHHRSLGAGWCRPHHAVECAIIARVGSNAARCQVLRPPFLRGGVIRSMSVERGGVV